jgi:hypothetical protein
MLETACRSPGGQPRKIAGKFCLAGNPAGKFSCQKIRRQSALSAKLPANCVCQKSPASFSCQEIVPATSLLPGKSLAEILAGKKSQRLVSFFVAAQEFVALNGRDYANLAFIAGFRALNASQATHAHWAGQSDFVGQGQQDFDGGAFLDILGEQEIDAAGANVARFGAGFADGRACGPAHGQWQTHLETLGGATLGPVQSGAS